MKSSRLGLRRLAFLGLALFPIWLVARPSVSLAAAAGTTYYVSSTGRDSATGLTPQTAWLTTARVNKASLHPGDQVLFQGGSTFTGYLSLKAGESGTPTSPITFGAYGTGGAIIAVGTGVAFWAYDAAGIALGNLNFVGAGAGISTSDGISFYNDLPGNVKLSYIRISNVDVGGFGGYGISIGGFNGASGYTDVQVTYSSLHDNRKAGLITYGPAFNSSTPTYANSNFYVGHVSASKNLGDPLLSTNSGSGILLGSVNGGVVERSSAYGNGTLCAANQCGAGIWTYDSTGITLQYNESYSNHSASHIDGDGFDLDQNVSASYVQYNYSHDNDGPGYLDYTGQSNSSHSGNTIRYNVSENDARLNNSSILIGGGVNNDNLYDNTVFVAASKVGSPPVVTVTGTPRGVTLRNNIFYAKGIPLRVVTPAVATSAVLFQQNDYYGSLTAVWGTGTYLTLDSWRAATHQESLGASNVGLTVNPALASPGGGGTIGNPDLLVNLSAYRLVFGSPMVNVGLNLQTLFGINMGIADFYGVPVSSAPDVGAGEVK